LVALDGPALQRNDGLVLGFYLALLQQNLKGMGRSFSWPALEKALNQRGSSWHEQTSGMR
jgi:hypothetical protein